MPDLRPDSLNRDTVSMQSSNPSTTTRESSDKRKLPPVRGRTPKPPRKKRKRQHRSPSIQGAGDDKFWAVKSILDERVVGHKVEYLIDWEDDDDTGLPYPPTWEPEDNVTEDAIESWLKRTQVASQSNQVSSSPAHEESSTQDTDPVLPPDWRRASRNRDAYGPRAASSLVPGDGQIIVELNQDPTFDRSEFHCIISSSAPASQAESNFSRDQRVIPDSQEASGNSLSQTHESQASLLRPSQPSEIPDSGGPFLTQPPFDTQEQLVLSPKANDLAPLSSAVEPHQSLPSPSPSEESSPAQSASQAAQIIEPLSSYGYGSGFQTQVGFDVFSDSDAIAPDTVSRRGLGRPVESQSSRTHDRPYTPAKMDGGTSSTSTPSSLEILRARMDKLREEKQREQQIDDFESLISMPSPKGDHLIYESAQEVHMGQQAAEPLLDLPQAPSDLLPDTLTSISHNVPEPASQIPLVPLPEHSELHTAEAADADPVLIDSIAHDVQLDSVADEIQPATLNPAALTLSIEENLGASPSVPNDVAALPSGQEGYTSADNDNDAYLLPDSPRRPNEYHVTLPYYNSAREPYINIIREYKDAIESYTECYRVVPYRRPDNVTITKIDEMLRQLLDMCDTPLFSETMVGMTLDQRARYSASSNSKFAFVSDFLEYLIAQQSNKKVVILIRPGRLLNMICDLVKTKQCRFIRGGEEMADASSAQYDLQVSVIPTSEMSPSSANGADAIIAFDYTCQMDLLPDRDATTGRPLILWLVCTASIQHLDMRVSTGMESLERKNRLIHAMVSAMPHVEDPPEREEFKPHKAAELFAKRLEIFDDDEFYWESQPLPDDIFTDLFEHSSQAQPNQHTQTLVSRKRLRDEDDEVGTKRVRVSQPLVAPDASQISDSLKSFLGEDMPMTIESNLVNVPVDKLEALMSRITQLETEREEAIERRIKYEDLCNRHEKELSSHKKWVNTMQPKYMDALKERGIYDEQYQKATKENDNLKAQVKSRDNEITSLKDRTQKADEKLAEANESLRNSSNPNLSKMAELEKEVAVKRDEMQALQKQVEAAQRDMEFFRSQYQDASQRAAQIGNENKALANQNKELLVQASANILRVNEAQSRGEVETLVQLLEQQKAIVQQRELEIEQLKAMKTGRRETRQASVPRSPRMSNLVNSPRPYHRVTSQWSRESSASALDSSNQSVYGSSTGHGRSGNLRS